MRRWIAVVLVATALTVLAPAMPQAQEVFGDQGSLPASVLELYRQGKFAEATPLAERHVAISLEQYGPRSSQYGVAIGWLGRLYQARGRLADAEPLLKAALAVSETSFGVDHPSNEPWLSSLASLYAVMENASEAARLYERDLAMRERLQGRDHPDVANTLTNLANVYLSQGRFADAEPLQQRALKIQETAFGPDHPSVGTILNNLGELYRAQGLYSEAERLYKRDLAIEEKAYGADHLAVATSLNNLGLLYEAQGRNADAELFQKRALAIREKLGGPEHLDVSKSLNNLGNLFVAHRRYAEAEPLYERAVAIASRALGPNHPTVATYLNNLAVIHQSQARPMAAELLFKQSLAVLEKALGPDHPDVALSLNNLANFYDVQGRFAEAEPAYKRSLAIREKVLGPDHPDLAVSYNNLAGLSFQQSDWALATDYWRKATEVVRRRARYSSAKAPVLTGKGRSELEQRSFYFRSAIKAARRLADKDASRARALALEMFQLAQEAQSSQAAASLAQMSARSASGRPVLADFVRERQDLIGEWQERDALRTAAVSRSADRRDTALEGQTLARLMAIDTRIAGIDERLRTQFPDYAALANPQPMAVADVQAQLGPDEALILLLDTAEFKPAAEETFVWVVTKTDMRWSRSNLGTAGLQRTVATLRCGLDESAWNGDGAARCAGLLKVRSPDAGALLPFDLARAHSLYRSLFADVEDLIAGKRLLIVPTGALNALPFQVLVTSLSSEAPFGPRERQVGLFGVQLDTISAVERDRRGVDGAHGAVIARITAEGPADRAGLKVDDILLSVDGVDVIDAPQGVEAVRNHAPQTTIHIRVQRASQTLDVPVTLGSTTLRDWVPLYLNASRASVQWLGTRNAITVLPAVSSLKALRTNVRASRATDPYVGFGNPLLNGGDPRDTRAWEHQHCAKLTVREKARVVAGALSAKLASLTRGGLANVDDLRSQAPLPETADELCAVARSLGVANPDRAVNLGANATETRLKALSENGILARAHVIHFATHGLVAGETNAFAADRAEPSLLLTPPEIPSERDDGLLTASEVAILKLDADWVILSACNTAAGDSIGGDALSGLARAFFYAGARSLLVSYWYVDSQPTVALITKSFAALRNNPRIGRAEGLRIGIASLISSGGPSAHPSAWAPFVVVGEGGAGR